MKSKLLIIFALLLLLTAVDAAAIAQPDPLGSKQAQPSDAGLTNGESDYFAYSPKGRRDPFKPLIQKKEKIATKKMGRPEKLKGPLEKFELSQYRLIALMVVKGVPRAMVKAPDGKSYTVKVGAYIGINDGFVRKIETKVVALDENGLRVEISPDRIVVEETSIDSNTGQEVKENRYIAM